MQQQWHVRLHSSPILSAETTTRHVSLLPITITADDQHCQNPIIILPPINTKKVFYWRRTSLSGISTLFFYVSVWVCDLFPFFNCLSPVLFLLTTSAVRFSLTLVRAPVFFISITRINWVFYYRKNKNAWILFCIPPIFLLRVEFKRTSALS